MKSTYRYRPLLLALLAVASAAWLAPPPHSATAQDGEGDTDAPPVVNAEDLAESPEALANLAIDTMFADPQYAIIHEARLDVLGPKLDAWAAELGVPIEYETDTPWAIEELFVTAPGTDDRPELGFVIDPYGYSVWVPFQFRGGARAHRFDGHDGPWWQVGDNQIFSRETRQRLSFELVENVRVPHPLMRRSIQNMSMSNESVSDAVARVCEPAQLEFTIGVDVSDNQRVFADVRNRSPFEVLNLLQAASGLRFVLVDPRRRTGGNLADSRPSPASVDVMDLVSFALYPEEHPDEPLVTAERIVPLVQEMLADGIADFERHRPVLIVSRYTNSDDADEQDWDED